MKMKTFKDEQGFEYSEDKKVLLSAPMSVWRYKVPEGTEEIAPQQFQDAGFGEKHRQSGICKLHNTERHHPSSELEVFRL